jgi:hypothetical protein
MHQALPRQGVLENNFVLRNCRRFRQVSYSYQQVQSSAQDQVSRVLVTIDGVWIGD